MRAGNDSHLLLALVITQDYHNHHGHGSGTQQRQHAVHQLADAGEGAALCILLPPQPSALITVHLSCVEFAQSMAAASAVAYVMKSFLKH